MRLLAFGNLASSSDPWSGSVQQDNDEGNHQGDMCEARAMLVADELLQVW